MKQQTDIMKELLDETGIKSRIKQTKSSYIFKTIAKSELQDYLDKGWAIVKENKHSVKVKAEKPFDQAFEDRIWTLFARLDFRFMNADRNFRLICSKDPLVPGKQVDIFAADDETVIICECKSSKTRKRASFQKDINEINGIKSEVIANVNKAFGKKMKYAWLFCTENVLLSLNDKQRIIGSNIVDESEKLNEFFSEHKFLHLNQDDIKYYEQLVDQIGLAAKYQLFARFFFNQDIPELKNKVPAIKGSMGGHTYYSFSVEPETLLKISYILHRTTTSEETINTYQRMVNKSRIKAINGFLDDGGFFPNAIIVNFDTKGGKPLQFDKASTLEHHSQSDLGVLHMPKQYKSAYIIDGQHRLYGYGNNKYRCTNTIPVVAFENLPADVQAKLFVDINHEQKSVSSNLLKTLDAELKWNSPLPDYAIQALKSKLAQLLTESEESPLYNRIKIGEDKKSQTRCVTLPYVFDYGFNKTNFFGEINKKTLVKSGPLYAGDLADKTLLKSFDFFTRIFGVIEENLTTQWEVGDAEGGFVARNIGVASTIVIVWDIMEHLSRFKSIAFERLDAEEAFDEVKPFLMSVVKFLDRLDKADLYNLGKQWGSTGVTKVRMEFQRAIHQEFPDFEPAGLRKYILESSGIYNDETRTNVINIQKEINRFIIKKLKIEYGEKDWWRLGVKKQIQKSCAERMIDEGGTEPVENFLDLIHYQTIISDNWKVLGDAFTQPNQKNVKKEDRLKWFVNLNNVRKKGMHPERQDITEEEYNSISELKSWLLPQLHE